MRKWYFSALAVFALVTGLACGPDTPTKGDPMPDPVTTTAAAGGACNIDRLPPDPPNLDHKRYVIVYGCVEDGFQPIELSTAARDNTTGEFGEHTEPSANAEVRYIIGYDTGHNVTLHVELKPSRPGSKKGFLYISDGEGNRKIVKIDKGWRALADFTVMR